MAELTTIARPYAEAAFRLARDENALPAWSEMLHLASAVIADPRMAAALNNPKLTADDKVALLLSVCGDRLDARGRSFVRVLVDADRVSLLPQIESLFAELKNQTDGVAKARIDSAFPLTDADVDVLKVALEKRFGRKIEATVHVEPSLIGGARITVGDSVIDASVEAQLHAMATQLRT
jgi:F-type H+-transporting ATPase subunit delta